MTKPRTYTYQIQYVDNTYRIVEWTRLEFKKVCEEMEKGAECVALDKGLFSLKDVRAIVMMREEKENKKEKESVLTEWGFVDPETLMWLKEQGIDVTGGEH